MGIAYLGFYSSGSFIRLQSRCQSVLWPHLIAHLGGGVGKSTSKLTHVAAGRLTSTPYQVGLFIRQIHNMQLAFSQSEPVKE